MKTTQKIILMILLISKVFGQGISLQPDRILFNEDLIFKIFPPSFSSLRSTLSFNSNSLTHPPILSFTVQGMEFGSISKNSSDDFNFTTNNGFTFSTLDVLSALKINKSGSIGVGIDPSLNARLDVDGNIRSSSLDFTEQASTERRLVFADANGVIRADNSTNQYQSYNFSAVQAQDYDDQLRKGSGYAWFNTTNIGATMYLPVNLPDGVKVTNVRAFLLDNAASDLIFTFSKNNHSTNSFTTIATAQTSGANASIQTLEKIVQETIQNQANSYYINISSVGNWIGNNLRFHSLVITYQYQ
jgi:hypothetical protein